jgi:hypothetical protein
VHGIETKEKDKKYFICLDQGERKFELLLNVRGERDRWYEVLKNSRKTAKEIKHSITGKPRNLRRLLNVVANSGVKKIEEICIEEIEKLSFNYKEM